MLGLENQERNADTTVKESTKVRKPLGFLLFIGKKPCQIEGWLFRTGENCVREDEPIDCMRP